MEPTIVYTDGGCSRNGQVGAKAGIGVYFSETDARNCSERIDGKQTNNTAEIKAIIKAADILKRELLAGFIVHIYSDSQYAIRCCTTFGEKQDLAGWPPIPNLSLVKQAYQTFKGIENVSFRYIAAHTGQNDIHSRGNDGADRLATLAIGKTSSRSSGPENHSAYKLYLNIPYEDKDLGKRHGTKWDQKKRKWYIMSDIDERHKEIILNTWPQ